MIDKSKNPVLLFSGGKDSLYCLYHFKDDLKDIIVVWVNTGKNFKVVEDTVNKYKSMCPIFVEIRVDRDLQWKQKGLPVDLMNMDNSSVGITCNNNPRIVFQSFHNCCKENIIDPALAFVSRIGCTFLIRGQKLSDKHKDFTRNGDIIAGVTICNPAELLSDQEVLDSLSEWDDDLPDHFRFNHTSLDCKDCTAYLSETLDRVKYLKKEDKAEADKLLANLSLIRKTILEPYTAMEKARKCLQ